MDGIEHKKTYTVSNNKTTAAGAVAGICAIVGIFVPAAHVVCEPIGALAILALGYFASDSQASITTTVTDKEFTPGPMQV
jgi:hypothetical protein